MADGQAFALLTNGTIKGWGLPVPAVDFTNVAAISAGEDHLLTLGRDGRVRHWEGTELAVPPGLTSVRAIAAGSYHDLALNSNGTVVAWGWNDDGQATVPPGLSNIAGVAAGYRHSVAVKSNGTVIAWGRNDSGQTNIPAGHTIVVAVAAGYDHTIALRSDGTVVGWGANDSGGANPPAAIKNAVRVVAGAEESLTLSADLTLSVARSNQVPVLRFQTFSGRKYSVQHKPLLPGSSWTNLAPLIDGHGGYSSILDTNPLSPSRFYRVFEQ